MKKIQLTALPALFASIAEKQGLYIPADVTGQPCFTRWQEGMTLTNALNTSRSAKDLFFPQTERLADFRVDGKNIEIREAARPDEDFTVFGVRACDARSFDILDSVFLNEPKDSFYENRRKHATVVTLACTAPEETCFCTALGIDPTDPAGDVTAWKTEEDLYLRANTEKGEAFLSAFDFEDAPDTKAVDAQREKTKKIMEKLPLHGLRFAGFGEARMMTLFNSPKWKALSESCLGCGTCTFVCPTCQCYDVKEFNTGKEIQRFRCWDSCMYSDFTMMSAGQPRPTQLERFRQRFLHKLCYYPANHDGVYGCVGCGRCLQKCPVHTNIVKVAKSLMEETE